MSRESILSSLVEFDAPVQQLKAALGTLTWDCAPVVTLMRSHISAVLERYSSCPRALFQRGDRCPDR
ncbi:hypothetical protein TM233_54540 [Bradyrhizobium sp. TM233]|nr:hypothetical protein TM233_54540 [Bradyrhizobium sp. TM233]